MSSRTWIGIVSGLAVLLTAGAVRAEDDATFVFTNETTQTIDLGNGVTANVFVSRGFLVFDDSTHRLHLANQDCYGTGVGTAEADESAGYCTIVPTSGDGGIWASWQGDQTGGTWTVMRGAGSLQGASGSGTWAPGGQWPDGKAYNRQMGTIKTP
jgi:hypothetical protein